MHGNTKIKFVYQYIRDDIQGQTQPLNFALANPVLFAQSFILFPFHHYMVQAVKPSYYGSLKAFSATILRTFCTLPTKYP